MVRMQPEGETGAAARAVAAFDSHYYQQQAAARQIVELEGVTGYLALGTVSLDTVIRDAVRVADL